MKHRIQQTEVTHILELTGFEVSVLKHCMAIQLKRWEEGVLPKDETICLSEMYDEIRCYIP